MLVIFYDSESSFLLLFLTASCEIWSPQVGRSTLLSQTEALTNPVLPSSHLIVFTALPLEIWSSFIFPQLPTLQDRLNCAHTCQSWRPCALRSVESLLLPNIDKKVKKKMPEEQTTLLQTHWSTEAMRVGCIAFEGMACMQDCGFAGSEQQLGFCSRCLWEAKCDNLDLDMCVRLNSPLFLLLTLLLSLILPLLLSSFLFRSFSIPGICNNGRNRSKNMIPFVINGGKRRGLKRHSTKAVGMLK